MSNEGGKTQPEDEVPRANPLHVAWLNEGVESWNRRRKEEPFKPVLTQVCFDDEELAGLDRIVAEGYTSLDSINDLSGVDLSGADLRGSNLCRGVFRGADFRSADLTGAYGNRADFSTSDFRGAQLWQFTAVNAKFNDAKFRGAEFFRRSGNGFWVPRSDLTDADFSGCNLTGADFAGSTLRWANLTRAELGGASLHATDLTDAKLAESRLWDAGGSLFDRLPWLTGTGLEPSKRFDFQTVGSLRDVSCLRKHLLDVYKSDVQRGRVAFYFRGEPCTRSVLQPTVMRHGLKRFERDLLVSLKTEFPAVFSGCEYAIDELAIARHYGLPSRLLDVTRNPLVGIYWATEEAEGEHRGFGCEELECSRDCSCVHPSASCVGNLHMFAIPTELVRPYDSDRVSIIANFARLPTLQQERLLTKREDNIDFGYLEADESSWHMPRSSMEESMKTLLHNIQREKPYFTGEIDVRDLFRVFVVDPRRSFSRIRAQSGAFMLSAFHERFEGTEVAKNLANTELYDHYVITIPAGEERQELRQELRN